MNCFDLCITVAADADDLLIFTLCKVCGCLEIALLFRLILILQKKYLNRTCPNNWEVGAFTLYLIHYVLYGMRFKQYVILRFITIDKQTLLVSTKTGKANKWLIFQGKSRTQIHVFILFRSYSVKVIVLQENCKYFVKEMNKEVTVPNLKIILMQHKIVKLSKNYWEGYFMFIDS